MLTERPREDDSDETGPDADRSGLSLAGLGLRIAMASAVIAGLSLFARRPADAPASATVPAHAEGPFVPSTPVAGPAPSPATLVRLALPEPGPDPVRVSAGRINPATGLREDVLTRGAFEALEAPALRLTLSRGETAGRAPGLFVLLARRAAGGPGTDGPALAVVRSGAYGRIVTKFGAVETLEVTLSGPLRRTCTGFVTRETRLRIDGWLCAPLGHPPEVRALACTLDALSLDDPADPAATAVFAEGRPGPGCDRPAAMAEAAGRTGSIGRRQARSKK